MFGDFERERIETDGAEIALRRGGSGPPVVLLHGYPQTGAMWHAVAPRLAERFSVIVPDLRGYGRSQGPSSPSTDDYSNRAMGADVVAVAEALGHDRVRLVGHDRGGRVAYRLALDHPDRLERLAALDVIPTLETVERMTYETATFMYHWFFLSQPHPFPETLIGNDPDYFCEYMLEKFAGSADAFAEAPLDEYREYFRQEAVIRATCEDYRAGMSVDLDHDRSSREAGERIECPMLALWGETQSGTDAVPDPVDIWDDWATDVRGSALACGHFMPEEAPDAVVRELDSFLAP